MKINELSEKKLERKDLMKSGPRLAAFIKKYAAGDAFVLAGQSEPSVRLKKDQDVLDSLKNGIIPDTFETEDGKTVRLTGLEKTGEFGGKGAGFSTRDEDSALADLNKQLTAMKGDNQSVSLQIGDKTVDVAGFVSTPGTPKSDFHAVDADGNEVAWLSHKKGSKAKDFGQWGGMSDREMKVVYASMPEAKDEILKFAKDVIDKYPDGAIPRATTLARKITNGKLRGISIYGNGFGGERGQQNVDLVLQGDPIFQGNKLVATGSAHSNGERLQGEFEPVLMAMYKGDRDNFGVKGARFSIYPAGGRKISEWI